MQGFSKTALLLKAYTLATQQHLEYHCKALFETPCITSGSHIQPDETRRVLLHYGSLKYCTCPLNKFTQAFKVVNPFLKHPMYYKQASLLVQY
jgi:hypothetical protein